MTPKGFAELAKLIPAQLLLLDAGGRVLEASAGPEGRALWAPQPKGKLLTQLVEDPDETVAQFLRSCRRSGQPLVGALTFKSREPGEEAVRCRCYGAGASPAVGNDRLIVLRIVARHGGGERDNFADLRKQLEQRDNTRRTQLKSAAEIANKEQRLAYLVETTQDAIIFIDADHNISQFNAAAERVFGYARDEALGRPVTMLMAAPHQSRHEDYISRYEATREARAIGQIREVEALRKDGTLFPMELSVTPLEPDSGVYAAFIRDISERHAMRDQLLAKERLAAIGTTSAMFAHEVANPLNGMSMHSQLLTRRLKKANVTDPQIHNNVSLITKEIHRLTQLLDDFRGLSKQQQYYRFSPVALKELLHEICEEQAPIHRTQGITVCAELSDAVPAVYVDRSKFKQALLNLCKNATEAMPDGGTLSVRLRSSGRSVRVEIGDTGCGIPKDVNVFEPFATTKLGGTGLGMPVVGQIIDAHNGTITYDSDLGAGTTFTIELPAAPRDGD